MRKHMFLSLKCSLREIIRERCRICGDYISCFILAVASSGYSNLQYLNTFDESIQVWFVVINTILFHRCGFIITLSYIRSNRLHFGYRRSSILLSWIQVDILGDRKSNRFYWINYI